MNYEVKAYEYEVLLSYPDYNNPNTIHTWNKNDDDWELISNGLAEPLGSDEALLQQEDPRGLIWWNAYSLNGSTTSEIVYVNYGTTEDYKILEKVKLIFL